MGLQFVVHGNTGGEPANKTPDAVKQQVQALIREKYYDLNLLHLAEMLETNEHIIVKRETLRKWAHDIHHVKCAKHRRTRAYKHGGANGCTIPELRLNMADANSYLQHVFIPQFWRKKLTVRARAPASEYTPLSRHINLDDICITKVYRKIRNDHTFSYGNKFYFIESPIKHSIAHQKIEIRKGKNEQFSTYFAGRQLQISEVTEPVKASMEETDVQKKLDVLALADRLGNVAEASRLSGVSLDTIYRHRRLLKDDGASALKRQEMPGLRHKNCTDISI